MARLSGLQGSGVMMALVSSNGLAVFDEGGEVAEPDAIVPVQMIDWDAGCWSWMARLGHELEMSAFDIGLGGNLVATGNPDASTP